MRYFSAAVISRVLDPLKALLASPCGRHAAFGRRRRSTRVRRYAPLPEVPAPVSEAAELPKPAAPAPTLAPPREAVPAEGVALVRPYFAAHERLRAPRPRVPDPQSPKARIPAPREPAPGSEEGRREFARVQERAAAILRQWSAAPDGELLAGPAPRFGAVRPTGPAPSSEWDELASLTRVWLGRQRQKVPA